MKYIKNIEKYNNFVKNTNFEGVLQVTFRNYLYEGFDERVNKESIMEFFEFIRPIIKLDEYFKDYVVSIYEQPRNYESVFQAEMGSYGKSEKKENLKKSGQLYIEVYGYYLKEIPSIQYYKEINSDFLLKDYFEGISENTFIPYGQYICDEYGENYIAPSYCLEVPRRCFIKELLSEGKNIDKEFLEEDMLEENVKKMIGVKNLSIGMEFNIEVHQEKYTFDDKTCERLRWVEKRIYKCKLLDYYKDIRLFDNYFTIFFNLRTDLSYNYLRIQKELSFKNNVIEDVIQKRLTLKNNFIEDVLLHFDFYYEWYMNYKENPKEYGETLKRILDRYKTFDDVLNKSIRDIIPPVFPVDNHKNFKRYIDKYCIPFTNNKFSLINKNSRLKRLIIEGEGMEDYNMGIKLMVEGRIIENNYNDEDDDLIYNIDECNIYSSGVGKYKDIENKFD